MSIKTVQISIKGSSPLLMHAYPMEMPEAMDKKTVADQAEIAAYRDPDTHRLYLPGVAVQRCFVVAAAYSKGKGRASLQKNAAACFLVDPERIDLGVKDYKIDSRPVVIAATKGRIVRHRPRIDVWEVTFTLEFDDTLLKEEEVRRIVDDAGKRVGLLDFRPAKNGPFGKFFVTKWKAEKSTKD